MGVAPGAQEVPVRRAAAKGDAPSASIDANVSAAGVSSVAVATPAAAPRRGSRLSLTLPIPGRYIAGGGDQRGLALERPALERLAADDRAVMGPSSGARHAAEVASTATHASRSSPPPRAAPAAAPQRRGSRLSLTLPISSRCSAGGGDQRGLAVERPVLERLVGDARADTGDSPGKGAVDEGRQVKFADSPAVHEITPYSQLSWASMTPRLSSPLAESAASDDSVTDCSNDDLSDAGSLLSSCDAPEVYGVLGLDGLQSGDWTARAGKRLPTIEVSFV